ncbi:hypothetical protein INS49_007199 [Diaporthe citri]|uniref:uncharacterized protein n=1 Tax=Diaporthe citri TaxID=83186 RepID=UPI001C8223F3|nr:uncharacterized protein INS49_007199 [Diaporthe citri]KAG6365588.1 hypothetical protein INS49_007199 [Diaporthe citri]
MEDDESIVFLILRDDSRVVSSTTSFSRGKFHTRIEEIDSKRARVNSRVPAAVVPVSRTSESSQPNISLAPKKSNSAVPKASVARVSTIIREVNKIRPKKGSQYNRPKDTDREFWSQRLSPREYAYLLERVHKNQELGHYFNHELRYEYSTSKNQFTILMSVTALHGTFVDKFKALLTRIGVYIEHGLQGEELAERARELINLSNGNIRTVVTVNLHDIYKESDEGKTLEENSEGPAAATVSVWRARLKDVDGRKVLTPECDYDEAFRDSGGNVVDSFKLCLFLSDFICEDHVIRHPGCEQVQIQLTARHLCDVYDVAVEQHVLERGAKSTPVGVTHEEDVHAEASSEEDVHVEASRQEEAPAEAAREENPPVVVPQPETRSPARRAIQGVAQILRRSERHVKKAAPQGTAQNI